MKLTKYEKETIINFNQEEDTASVYTCDEAWIRKLDAICQKDQRIRLDCKDEVSKTYIMPKKAVKVRLSMNMSDEKLKELIVRGRENYKKGLGKKRVQIKAEELNSKKP